MIIGTNATQAWENLISAIHARGQYSVPRGKMCLELIGEQTRFPMEYPIVTNKERKLGYLFMAAEAAWILNGDNKVKTIAPYSKNIAQFSDDGVTFFGAYGPKIWEQLQYVVETLANDERSRQAVMTIWRENPPPSKDIPCTVSVQFLIREGMLHCIDTMRSSDAWLGWPYDAFNFSMLSAAVIIMLEDQCGLDLRLGDLIMNLGSSHLYETNIEMARGCFAMGHEPAFTYSALKPLDEWLSVREMTRDLEIVAKSKPPRPTDRRPAVTIGRWINPLLHYTHNNKPIKGV